MSKLLELHSISKEYNLGKEKIPVLKNLDATFDKGKFYAIMGHSGSGKSTLIRILGLLEQQTNGTYKINGVDTSKLKMEEKTLLRRDSIGIIFQDYYLDDYLKAYENVIFPMLINKKIDRKDRKRLSLDLLDQVDLTNRVNHYPKELSGGEQQRVAIARALGNNPSIILADEPTGNLDKDNEKKVLSILKDLSKKGKCIIVVSHSNEVKEYADVIYKIEDKKLIGDKI